MAAVDEATAIEALSLFDIEWEELEPVFDPKRDPKITMNQSTESKYHLARTNVQKRIFQEFGDRSLVKASRLLARLLDHVGGAPRFHRTTRCGGSLGPKWSLQLHTPKFPTTRIEPLHGA